MEIDKDTFAFQTDSDIVNRVYEAGKNYFIEEDPTSNSNFCVLYFSSNNIYYPNNEEVFLKRIVYNNKFEWYGTRINSAAKHIFLRDIKKQWYLSGLNQQISNPQAMIDFLKRETAGYKIIALGSSAGGFAAVLFGQILGAERIYSFNGQFEINSLLVRSSESVDPLLFRYRRNSLIKSFYDIKDFITNPSTIYYFCSSRSSWDIEQHQHVSDLKGITTFSMQTSHHGIPFLKTSLPSLLNMDPLMLQNLGNRTWHPLLFSYKVAGLDKSMKGLMNVTKIMIKKRRTTIFGK